MKLAEYRKQIKECAKDAIDQTRRHGGELSDNLHQEAVDLAIRENPIEMLQHTRSDTEAVDEGLVILEDAYEKGGLREVYFQLANAAALIDMRERALDWEDEPEAWRVEACTTTGDFEFRNVITEERYNIDEEEMTQKLLDAGVIEGESRSDVEDAHYDFQVQFKSYNDEAVKTVVECGLGFIWA